MDRRETQMAFWSSQVDAVGQQAADPKRQTTVRFAAMTSPSVHAVTRSSPAAPVANSPVDLIDKTFALADECGGIEQLKRLVNKLAER